MFKSKGLAESIVDKFESKFPREKSGKMKFGRGGSVTDNPDTKLEQQYEGEDYAARDKALQQEREPGRDNSYAEGGEIEDPDHMEELATHAEAMHEAHKSGDHMAHAHALKAFLHAHEAHEAKKKDVDNGPVSDEKDAPNKIAGDEYK